MKLTEYKKRADEYSKVASDIVRKLLLAGIAIIWLFKLEEGMSIVFAGILLWPLLFLSLGLLFDLLQYVAGNLIWRNFYLTQEKINKSKNEQDQWEWHDADVKAPKKLKRPIVAFYWLKIVCMIVAYLFLIIYIYNKTSFS